MAAQYDRIVVGGGAMGLATCWQLAQRGIRVLLLEQFEPGHHRGASHGATRNLNNAYSQAHFLDLYDEALGLWQELEAAAQTQLLSLGGLVNHGDPARVRAAHAALTERGAVSELISAAAAEQQWPGMRFAGEVLVNRDAGRINAADTLTVLHRLASELGAELRYQHRVLSMRTDAAGVQLTVLGPDGERVEFTAAGVVVTAGAWSAPLLHGLVDLPPLRVTEEHPAHFAIRAPFTGANWPSFNHFQPAAHHTGYSGNVYGMLTPGEGMKVGFHATGDEVHPDHRRFRAPAAARAQLHTYVTEWFPGLDPDSAVEISCTYTLTPSERFVLDRRGAVTVGAGFSGHGFKFVPAIGRVLADATLGVAPPPAEFRLDAHH